MNMLSVEKSFNPTNDIFSAKIGYKKELLWLGYLILVELVRKTAVENITS